MKAPLLTALRAALLLVLPGLVAWATGRPFLFPSLGPTAYSLIRGRRPGPSPRVVIGGHAWGVAAGILSHELVATGLRIVAGSAPGSADVLRLGLAGILSVALTVVAMEATRTSHSPACATTLIVSLGLLPSLADGVIIIVSVAIMVATDRLLPEKKEHRAHEGPHS